MKNISKQITFKIANDAIQSESIEQANAVKPAKINLLSRFKSKKVVMLKRMSVMLLSLVVCMSMMPAMAFADAPDHVGGGVPLKNPRWKQSVLILQRQTQKMKII